MKDVAVDGGSARYDRIPVDYMRGAIERYIERGIKPGGFLTALLTNDLMDAVVRADDDNSHAIRSWVIWLHNYAPRGCYGSPENVSSWVEQQHRANAGESTTEEARR